MSDSNTAGVITANRSSVFLRVEFSGMIDEASEDEFHSILEELRHTTRVMIISFQKVSYISAEGLSLLIRLVRACRDQDVLLIGYGLNELQEKLFQIVGITDNVLFYPDEYAVLKRVEGMQIKSE